MDRQLHEQTSAYLTELLASVKDPEAKTTLTHLLSQLGGSADDPSSPEKKAGFLTDLGREVLKATFGDPSLNAEHAIRYLEEALSLWPVNRAHERALTLYTLGVAHGDRRKAVSVEGIEKAIGYFEQALLIWKKETTPTHWATTMSALGSAYLVRTLGDPRENKERAIACLEQTLSVWTREASPNEWARTLYELGNVYNERIDGDPAENREKAIVLLDQALSVRTMDSSPTEWAMTMYALGNAYMVRIDGDPGQNIEEGIHHYRQALTVWTREDAPGFWALAMNALGAALGVRIHGGPAENQEEAIACLTLALSVRTREATPLDWASILYALGNTYAGRIKDNPSVNLEKAIHCFRDALSVRTKERMPMDWAMTRYALANAYRRRIAGDPAENVEKAIALLDEVLTVWRKDVNPMNWATAIFVLGNAYAERHRGSPADNIEKAIECVQEALSVWTMEALPMNWAMAMNILGQTYGVRIRGDLAKNREEAIIHLSEALTAWTKEVIPLNWAHTMHALGQVYSQRIKGDPKANREKAIECYQQALSVRRKELVPLEWAKTMHALGKVYRDGSGKNAAADNASAIACFEEVLEARKKELVPMDWAATMAELGAAYAGSDSADPPTREEIAIDCLNQVLTVWTRDVVPRNWAEVKYRLGNIHAERKTGEPLEKYREAVRCYREALSVVDAETRPQLYYLARYGLGFSLLHQARLEDDKELRSQALDAIAEALKLVSVIHMEIADPKARRDYLRRSISLFDVGVQFMLEERRYAEALYWIEQMRSRGLLEDLNLEQLSPRNEQASERVRLYWDLCHEVRGLRAALAMDREDGGMPGNPGNNRRQQEMYTTMKDHLSRQKALLDELTLLDPDYFRLIQPEPLREADLFELLSQTGSAAVACFFRRESPDLHFLIAYSTESGLAYKHILKDLRPILLERALGSFVGAFGSGGASILRCLDNLLEVSGQMIKPVAGFLRERGIQRIYLSPHAFLHAFPLHAALLPDTKRFFIEEVEVCYTPSLTLSYRLFRSEACAGKKAVALFYASADRPLAYGEQELKDLIENYGEGQVVPLHGREASFEGLVAASESMRRELSLVALGCHGRRTAEGISLELADGVVSHVEMMRKLNFSGLPLAVLAACETGRSDEWNQQYEDYLALDGVFLQMGTRGVVSSFYPIDDQGASVVMKAFHRRLSDGVQPAKALHEAQRKVLRDGFEMAGTSGSRGRMPKQEALCLDRGTHPYYWAFLKYSGTL
jgi:tetratricopeptide (TPR) repeat protein